MKNILKILFVSVFCTAVIACKNGQDSNYREGLKSKENSIRQSPSDSLIQMINKHDRAIHLMKDTWMRDPFIALCPDGNYYLSATRMTESFPDSIASIEFWRSQDLTNWEKLGVRWRANDSEFGKALLKKAMDNDRQAMIWAPEIHFINGKWIIVNTSNMGMANLMITESDELAPPYIEPFGAELGHRHDPSIFMDDDQPYLVYKMAAIQRLKKDFSGFDGEEINIGPSDRKMGHEGAYIIKVQNKYILFGTAWSTDEMRKGTYNLYYAVSDKVNGPYGKRQFAGRFLGHGTPFKDKNGNWWCTAFYNANEPTLKPHEVENKDMSNTAFTINKQGLTLVPMEIKIENDAVKIKALDPAYQNPGNEEVQNFQFE
ncbi:family 43 glycosylhydrolase [Leeuwenhoekiella parthenopeia]|uniref:Family 43 glycosylhydrolase n=1 Tax=Leeuwenhoekiella parthenopeia TaxID=2890320 RepID=A0ABS8GMS5_9FLAO|nr:family 43 glycosylhydrolase [Leeuwenhoekiella parthenopeia]MCC4211281.1 family 43 glycosylhydrolase [Leeuwenhoekiella parthenopeia]